MRARWREIFRLPGRPSTMELLVFLLLVGATFLVAHVALAQDATAGANQAQSSIGLFLMNFLSGVIKVVGNILLLLTDVFLIPIAGYNNFVNATAVAKGWVVVRDLTNMFFVLMMLIISIGTILGVEDFSYRKLLPRLLIIAVVINFSKLIVGVFIDFAQVIMLTFVNGFAAAAGGNIIQLFQVVEAMKYSDKIPPGTPASVWDVVGGEILALLMLMIAIMIVAIMCMMLAFRIVMLWILTILAPIAFFSSTLQRGQASKVYGQWWSKLTENLISGPLLAFFLWLAFTVTQAGGLGGEVLQGGAAADESELSQDSRQYFITEAGGTSSMTGFIVGIALLLAGMYVTAEMGGAGSGMLRGGADWLRNKGQAAAKGLALAPLRAGVAAGRFGERKLYAATGIGLAPSRYTKAFKQWREGVAEQDELAGREKAARAARAGGRLAPIRALVGSPDDFFRNYMSAKGVKLAARQIAFGAEDKQLARAADRRAEAAAYRTGAKGTRSSAASALAEAERIGAGIAGGRASAADLRAVLPDLVAKTQEKLADLRRRGASATAEGRFDDAANIGGLAQDEQSRLARMQEFLAGGAEGDVELSSFGDLQAHVVGGLSGRGRSLRAEAAAMEAQARSLEEEAAGSERVAGRAEARAGGLTARAEFAEAAIRKRISEEKKNLPENMTPIDRRDYTEGAVRDGNWERFQIMLSKIGDEEEMGDLLGDERLWGRKFGTDSESLQQFAQQLQQRFGTSQEDTLRTLSNTFGTLVGKGQTGFLGRLTQDRGTGRLRWNDEGSMATLQAGKLDKQSLDQIYGRDSVNAIAETLPDGTTRMTDAGLAKTAASHGALTEKLKKNKVHPKVLKTLKDNAGRLAELLATGAIAEAQRGTFAEFMTALESASAEIKTAKGLIDKVRRA